MAFRVPTDQPTRRKSPRKEEPDHLAYIRKLPCVICLAPAEAAHVNYSDARYGKVNARGMKADDRYTAPLCRHHHEVQHLMKERNFWQCFGIPDPNALCLALHSVSPDAQRGEKIVMAWRDWINR